ncbi:MAG: hypothetical protein GF346_02160 [Candidatus Eisenbacteria bacterium]|nr:hypothetical protein [Candidatus Latescibacterota bacterium]MBD3301236.1 hypothetical protein [Candidatus Eisenbacteria bacterium]
MPQRNPVRFLFLCAAALLALPIACTESSNPVEQQEPPPPSHGWLRGTVESIPGMESIRSDLHVYSALDSARIDADGRFLVAVDSLASLCWLVVAAPGGPPILLAGVSPEEEEVRIDANTTMRALLEFDPLLDGVPAPARRTVAGALEEALRGPAASLRERLTQGRFDSLVDPVDPAVQRRVARLLRDQVGAGRAESADPAPWIEETTGREAPIEVANPLAIHVGVGVHRYFSGDRLRTVSLAPAPLEAPLAVSEAIRGSIHLPSGRYRLSFHTGAGSESDSAGTPATLAMQRNLQELLARTVRRLLRIGDPLPWIESPGSFEPSDFDGIEAVLAARTEGDPIAYRRSALELLDHNRAALLPGIASPIPRLLLPIAIAGTQATEGLDPGLHLAHLFESRERVDLYARVDPDGAIAIGPPDVVRPPEDLIGHYGHGTVHLHWRDVADNEDGYIVERRMDGFFSERATLPADATTFRDTGFRPDWVYTFRVFAYNEAATSPSSKEVPIETRDVEDVVPPAAVTDLRVIRILEDGVEIGWTAPGDDGFLGRAQCYEIRHAPHWVTEGTWDDATVHPESPAVLAGGLPQRFTLRGLDREGEHWIALRAYDESGLPSPVSNQVRVVVVGGDPDDRWLDGFGPYPEGMGPNAAVFALEVYEGDLIAGGNFTRAGGTAANHVARWDGTAWHPLGEGMDGYVRGLTTYDGDLIAVGLFERAGGKVVNGIARWDGTSWNPIGAGANGNLYVAAVYEGDLVVGGAFHRIDTLTTRSIARFDGSRWHSLGSGVNNQVFGLFPLQGDLLVGGDFSVADGVPGTGKIARWDGSRWHSLGGGMDLDYVRAMAVFRGDLVAGGQFVHAGEVIANNLARYNGSSWDPIGRGTDRWVRSMVNHDGLLYVGGDFWRVDDLPLWHIARWDGTEWSPLGSGIEGKVHCMTVYESTLVVGGWFETAGGKSSHRIAFWKL